MPDLSVLDVIRRAHALLPGEPAAEGETDPRWQAIIAVGEFLETEPEAVWEFILTWGGYPQEDLRDAIATCLLEHLLDVDFATYFPRVKRQVKAGRMFGDTFDRCWKMGQATETLNAARFDRLQNRRQKRGRRA